MRKGFLIYTILLLFILQVYSASASLIIVRDPNIPACTFGDLYVNTIQSGVNAAVPGDTIYVCPKIFNYVENVVVDKRVNIFGFSNNNEVVVEAADSFKDVFNITSDYVNIGSFNLKYADGAGAGVRVTASHVEISGVRSMFNIWGFILQDNRNITMMANLAKGNLNSGVLIVNSSNNVLRYNAFESNDNVGVMTRDGSDNNNISYNVISNNGDESIQVIYSSYNNYTSNLVNTSRDADDDGTIYVSNANYSSFNTLIVDGLGKSKGFNFINSKDNIITNTSVYNTTLGIHFLDSNATINDTSFYNNTFLDFYLNITHKGPQNVSSIKLNYVTFGLINNSPHTFANNISMFDKFDPFYNTAYVINSTSSPRFTPNGRTHFRNSYLTIINKSLETDLIIDNLKHHWTDKEVMDEGANESKFEFWKNNDYFTTSWILLSDQPDTVNNEFSVNNIYGHGNFTIFMRD